MVRKGLEEGPVAGYEAEADGFAELGMTSESKALKSLFFGRVSHYYLPFFVMVTQFLVAYP